MSTIALHRREMTRIRPIIFPQYLIISHNVDALISCTFLDLLSRHKNWFRWESLDVWKIFWFAWAHIYDNIVLFARIHKVSLNFSRIKCRKLWIFCETLKIRRGSFISIFYYLCGFHQLAGSNRRYRFVKCNNGLIKYDALRVVHKV